MRLKLEAIDKTVRVTGDRVFVHTATGVRPTRPAPFLRLPLSWQRAYGGTDAPGGEWEARNPVGVGFAVDPHRLVGQPAPNFEYAGERGRLPAGFGPVARHWQPRVRYAGSYDDAWSRDRDPLLPRDFDRASTSPRPRTSRPAGRWSGTRTSASATSPTTDFWQFLLPRVSFDIVTQFYRRHAGRPAGGGDPHAGAPAGRAAVRDRLALGARLPLRRGAAEGHGHPRPAAGQRAGLDRLRAGVWAA